MITYRTGNDINFDAVLAVYAESGLGERRPMHDRERMRCMLANANLVVTAWHVDQLIGLARSITDWTFCTYLSDLAVVRRHQRMGIGKELIRQTQRAAPQASLILLAAPDAVDYYPRIGMEPHPSAWRLRPGRELV